MSVYSLTGTKAFFFLFFLFFFFSSFSSFSSARQRARDNNFVAAHSVHKLKERRANTGSPEGNVSSLFSSRPRLLSPPLPPKGFLSAFLDPAIAERERECETGLFRNFFPFFFFLEINFWRSRCNVSLKNREIFCSFIRASCNFGNLLIWKEGKKVLRLRKLLDFVNIRIVIF